MELVKFVVWQVEKGASGTRHLQGYFVTHAKHGDKGRTSLKWVKDKINSMMHIEKRMGSHEQAVDYCQKKDTRIAGPWTLGEHIDEKMNKAMLGEKKKDSLNIVKDAIDNGATFEELWEDHYGMMCRYGKSFKQYSTLKLQNEQRPDPLTFVFWGAPGTGKTHRVITSLRRLNATAFWYRPGVNGAWFDGYDPLVHNAVVFDEFKGQVPYTLFLALLDKYPCHVEGKGTSIAWRPKYIFITSNFAPNEWYGRNGDKKLHSVADDVPIVVEKTFDCSALMRRLAPPMGKIYEMNEKFNLPEIENADLEVAAALIEATDDEDAANILSTIIDLTTPPQSPLNEIDDNPYLNYQEGNGEGEYDDNKIDDDEIDDDDDVDWENEKAPYIVETPSPRASPPALNRATILKRTDEFTFRKPEQSRSLFKKLGKEPVQSTLAWAPKRKRKNDDDDDVDDKIENSQKK